MDKKFKQYTLTLQKIRDVGDTKVGQETNFGCIAINGKKAYCIKTNTANTSSDLFYYSDYSNTKVSPKQVVIKNKLGHGNGVAYYNNALWVATKTKNIVKIDLNDNYKRYTFAPSSGNAEVSGIAHFHDDTFIVKTGGGNYNGEKYIKYQTITFGENKKYSFDDTKPIKVINPKYDNKFRVPQDICYHNGNLYIILGKKEEEKPIKENVILVVDLSNRHTVTKGLDGNIVKDSYPEYFYPQEILVVKKKTHTSYELESLDFDSNGNMIVAANIVGNGDHDSILKVTKKTAM